MRGSARARRAGRRSTARTSWASSRIPAGTRRSCTCGAPKRRRRHDGRSSRRAGATSPSARARRAPRHRRVARHRGGRCPRRGLDRCAAARVHAFGTGHSHMLAEELFYRAGGLVRVRPILFEGLMLHAGAELSTRLERLPRSGGRAARRPPDRRRRRPDRGLELGRQRRHVASSPALARDAGVAGDRHRQPGARDVADGSDDGLPPGCTSIADVVIDNGGVVGDAAIDIDGLATAGRPDVDGRRSGRAQRDRRRGGRAARRARRHAGRVHEQQRRGRRRRQRARCCTRRASMTGSSSPFAVAASSRASTAGRGPTSSGST